MRTRLTPGVWETQSGELPAVPTIQPSALFPPRTFFLITSSLQPSRWPGSFFPTPQQWSRKRHGYHPLGSSQHACPAARILPDALKEKSRRPGRTPAPSLEDPPRPVSNTPSVTFIKGPLCAWCVPHIHHSISSSQPLRPISSSLLILLF